ncbi:MAG: response regulator transcription factor [Candidatus Micropelagos sp.]|nr:response regulator transcription factor [Candidatus Micropelagos sp.]
MRILIIEDDALLAERIQEIIEEAGHEVDHALTGEEGLSLAEMESHNVIILDMGLPDMSGNDITKALRNASNNVPILVLSARTQLEDKLAALDLGADDFMIKPFHRDELLARLHALLRRSEGLNSHVVQIGDLQIDIRNKQLLADNKPVTLTRKEFEILELLAMRQGRPVEKSTLMNHLYGSNDEPEIKIIDVFICTLRKKLAEYNKGRHCIENVWGRGYALRDCEA